MKGFGDKRTIGLVGMGVMGSNLALNFLDRGYSAAVYDRDAALLEKFMLGEGRERAVIACDSPNVLCDAIERPRKILLMVTAGPAVDWCIDEFLPYLEPGDILIDAGNSFFEDTIRRTNRVEAKGCHFIGMGVSGGEEGARRGPSLMPGGSRGAWPHLRELLRAIAARADDGTPCCDYVGPDGAGHYVKMVHNGIEYSDMQLICEAYWLMRTLLGMGPEEQSAVFAGWHSGELRSYLIEITSRILAKRDEETGQPVVDLILDRAGQKGTGKWTSQSGLDLGAPIPTIAEAVFARCMSAIKEERLAACERLQGPKSAFSGDKAAFVEDIRRALYASKICSYAQGFQLLRYASREYHWDLDGATIAGLWRAGCIIRAQFLERIREAYAEAPECVNLMLVPYFRDALAAAQGAWRRVVSTAALLGAPVPAFSSALAYYDSYRSAVLPANLLQAQRDYFGAHRYERVDMPAGETFHTQWGEG